MNERRQSLVDVFDNLPPEQQQAVYEFALSLQQTSPDTNAVGKHFYICPVCFATAEQPVICHEHLMIRCQADSPEDCLPQVDRSGHAQTRAPRWFTEAVQRLRVR